MKLLFIIFSRVASIPKIFLSMCSALGKSYGKTEREYYVNIANLVYLFIYFLRMGKVLLELLYFIKKVKCFG